MKETPTSIAEELARIVARQKVRNAYSPIVRDLERLALAVRNLASTDDEQDDIRDAYYDAYNTERALYISDE